jgi:hypothetical protein
MAPTNEMTCYRWQHNNGARQPDAVRWTAADLDRCTHGRHSIDSCFDCPEQRSTGNQFLLPGSDAGQRLRVQDGRVQVRIGTMVHGEPIWVVIQDRPRPNGDRS